MGYKDDQLYGLPTGVSDVSLSESRNPDFPFTDKSRVIRTVRQQADGSLKDEFRPMGHGFIRNLIRGDFGYGPDVPNFESIKCYFQFNPQDIEQSVESRKDMYLPILQDPSQFTQPIAGSTSFRFELLFDRTAEVNEASQLRGRNLISNPDIFDFTSASGRRLAASEIGVLSDLMVLHSVIGQGISKGNIDAMISKFNSDARTYIRNNYTELDLQPNSDGSGFIPITIGEGDSAVASSKGQKVIDEFLTGATVGNFTRNFMELNANNSAILLPQPVRVVFSSLFMVDGFVLNSGTLFTKFNSAMVPTQCKVLLNMQAVYLGFARERTFLSDQLEKTEKEISIDLNKRNTVINSIQETIKQSLSTVNVGLFATTERLIDSSKNTITVTDPNSNEKFKYDARRVYPWMFASKNFWYDRGNQERVYNAPDSYPGTHKDRWVSGDIPDSEIPVDQPPDFLTWYQPYDGGIDDDFTHGESTFKAPSGKPAISMLIGPNETDRNFIGQQLFTSISDALVSIKQKIRVNVFGKVSESLTVSKATAKASRDSYINATRYVEFTGDPVPPPLFKLMGVYSFEFDPINNLDSWEQYTSNGGVSSIEASIPQNLLLSKSLGPEGLLVNRVAAVTDIYNKINGIKNLENCITPKSIYNSIKTKIQSNETAYQDWVRTLSYFFDDYDDKTTKDSIWTPSQAGIDNANVNSLYEQEDPAKMRGSLRSYWDRLATPSTYVGADALRSLLPEAHVIWKDEWFIIQANVSVDVEITPQLATPKTLRGSGSSVILVQGDGRTEDGDPSQPTQFSVELTNWSVL